MRANKTGRGLTIREIACMGMMLAVLEAAKHALQSIPNVELATLLFILYTLHFGRKTIFVAFGFTFLEACYWGVHNWVIMYLYMWPLLILIVDKTRKEGSVWFYSLLSGGFGLFFGALCSIVYWFIGGPSMAFAWWVAGIPYDVIHCVSNFLLCLLLFRPLNAAFARAFAFVTADAV